MKQNSYSGFDFIDEYRHIGIVYEDNHVLVVHKPRNMLVQTDDSYDRSLQEELQDYLKYKYNKPGNVFVGIVHRLDRPVSGLMVFAKTSKAASRLSEQMRTKSFTKVYLAIVQGKTPERGKLVHHLLKNEKTNTVSVVHAGTAGAKEAILEFERLNFADDTSLLRIHLETGRAHQIRVQLAKMGNALVGDAKYGAKKGKTEQIELKSVEIGFLHPTTKEKMLFTGIESDSVDWIKLL